MCKDDSCDLSHCAKCGSHMLGGYLLKGTICDMCSLQEETSEYLKSNNIVPDDNNIPYVPMIKSDEHIVCTVHPDEEKLKLYRNGACIGTVEGDRILLGTFFLTLNDLDIIQDNWNQLQEMIRLKTM